MSFKFTQTNIELANAAIQKYPEGKEKSAILYLLDLAQRQNDRWLSKEAIEYVADFLKLPYIRVYEVVTFYTMFNTKPVGKYHLQVCGTTPCWLRGSAELIKSCENHLKIKIGETTEDKMFTLSEVECLGACTNAPVVQVNDDFVENLDEDLIIDTIEILRRNKK
jgi:NADH-quinone oxidoreductase E subunit